MASGLEIESATVVTDLVTAPVIGQVIAQGSALETVPVIDLATALANAQATGLEQRLLAPCAHCLPRPPVSLPNRSSRVPPRRVRVATTAVNVRTNAKGTTTDPRRPWRTLHPSRPHPCRVRKTHASVNVIAQAAVAPPLWFPRHL